MPAHDLRFLSALVLLLAQAQDQRFPLVLCYSINPVLVLPWSYAVRAGTWNCDFKFCRPRCRTLSRYRNFSGHSLEMYRSVV